MVAAGREGLREHVGVLVLCPGVDGSVESRVGREGIVRIDAVADVHAGEDEPSALVGDCRADRCVERQEVHVVRRCLRFVHPSLAGRVDRGLDGFANPTRDGDLAVGLLGGEDVAQPGRHGGAAWEGRIDVGHARGVRVRLTDVAASWGVIIRVPVGHVAEGRGVVAAGARAVAHPTPGVVLCEDSASQVQVRFHTVRVARVRRVAVDVGVKIA